MEEFKTIASLLDDLSNSDSSDPNTIWLFRGQDTYQPLLPAIARSKMPDDLVALEESMLGELKRRSGLLLKEDLNSDWDWLIYAQHFGLTTRLLDWSSNPLVALWFAIKNKDTFNKKSYLYILGVDSDDYLTDKELNDGPFKLKRTKVVKPTLNNNRIVAQQGWFTVHFYSASKARFSYFEDTKVGNGKIFIYVITPHLKSSLLKELSMLGINFQSMFPDVVGLCDQINWENKLMLK